MYNERKNGEIRCRFGSGKSTAAEISDEIGDAKVLAI
jgi:hypothetical protein